MKKLIALSLWSILILTSCNNDDDTTSNIDTIVGVWKPFKAFEDGIEETISACEDLDRLTFNVDGTMNFKFHTTNVNSNCEVIEDQDGTWAKEGNNTYTTVYDFFPYQPETHDFFFVDNTFYFEYSDFNGTIDPVMVTHRKVFIRVE